MEKTALTFKDWMRLYDLLAGRVESWELNDAHGGADLRQELTESQATLKRIEKMILEYPRDLIEQEKKGIVQ